MDLGEESERSLSMAMCVAVSCVSIIACGAGLSDRAAVAQKSIAGPEMQDIRFEALATSRGFRALALGAHILLRIRPLSSTDAIAEVDAQPARRPRRL